MYLYEPDLPEYPCVEGGGLHPCTAEGSTTDRDGVIYDSLWCCKLCKGWFNLDDEGTYRMIPKAKEVREV